MFIRYPIFDQYEVELLTTSIRGGVSQGNYSSLNLCTHSGDMKENVDKNRQRLAQALDVSLKHLFIPFQTHEDKIKVIDHPFLRLSSDDQTKELHGIDALITQERNIAIGVTTADCVPITIYDPINHVLGVAHAGWKGTVAHIGAKTVQKMVEAFSSNASDMKVSIGPSISQEMFEVGDEVGDAFSKGGYDLKDISLRKQETGKLHLDLWKANLLSLVEVGVLTNNIEVSGICTFQTEEFFSARRQTIKSGRMFTGGILK